jgi:two-component system LytT family response regulator
VEQLYQDLQNPKRIYDKIAVPTTEGFIIIPVDEIVYCHANSNYTEFHLTDKKCILSSYTLKQYDEILTSQSFFRAHRSYLVNMSHVKMYRKGEGGEIVMSNGHEIELARTHKDEFMHLLNIKQ